MDSLSDEEKLVILNALSYMVEGGLTSFDFDLYRSAFNKVRDSLSPGLQEPTFDDVLRACGEI